MQIKYLALILLFAINLSFSQDKKCNCINEIDNISKLIKNAKSYKLEIKKKNKEADFENWKEEIKQEIANDSLINFFCIGYLQKYISFINDRHNEIYSLPNKTLSNVPFYKKEIDIALKNNDNISGIYYAGSDKIVVKKEKNNIWYGITLKSNSKKWMKGKIRLRINKNKNNEFELFEFYKNGQLFYQKNIKIKNGRISSTFWNKDNKYFFNKNHKENFSYKSINTSFDYIAIKTFKRTNTLIKKANNFYTKILHKLTKRNLIIDLRNNGGGSTNQARQLLKFLKRSKAIQKFYVLVNFKTASATELILLQLKKDKRTVLVGENSRGMLKYGYGNKAFFTTTNCANFKVTLSTKITNKSLEKYEYIGIKPDYYLNNNTSWIEQIITLNAQGK